MRSRSTSSGSRRCVSVLFEHIFEAVGFVWIQLQCDQYCCFPDNDATVNWTPANFQTHCWFLTLHAHHLAIMPAIQRYGKHLRAIKEINRMISELQKSRAHWENTPAAARNTEVFNRWKQQIKNLTRYGTAHILVPFESIYKMYLRVAGSQVQGQLRHCPDRSTSADADAAVLQHRVRVHSVPDGGPSAGRTFHADHFADCPQADRRLLGVARVVCGGYCRFSALHHSVSIDYCTNQPNSDC